MSTIVTAVIVSGIFVAGPTVAQAAYDAVNADKVDGKHAVGAGSTVANRKGKLVATSPTTGRLPNNIIDGTVYFRGYQLVKGAQVTLPQNGYAEAFVTCPGTKVVVSGGWTTTDGVPTIDVFRSEISEDFKTYTTTAKDVSNSTGRKYWAYAICANV
jgi:hypothetical protein